MRAITIPFVGRPAPADALLAKERTWALRRVLLAALDRLAPPPDLDREPEPPPEWYKYPPF
jgi:hypothetical protein